MTTAMIVIDAQEEYFARLGKVVLPRGQCGAGIHPRADDHQEGLAAFFEKRRRSSRDAEARGAPP
jgi:nicotinamidase-related amidase